MLEFFNQIKNWWFTSNEDYKFYGKLFSINYFEDCTTVAELDEKYNKIPDSDRMHPFDEAITSFYYKQRETLMDDKIKGGK